MENVSRISISLRSRFPFKMKNVIILLVMLSSFSKVCSHPSKKRHTEEEVTLPCCEDVEVIECRRGTLWTVFLILLLLFLLLLLLGCIKGLMGLCCPFVGIWGLAVMTGHRQPLVCCYETQIADYPVICDCHDPSSKSHKHHTVHIYNRTTEFCLNLIFFLAYPIALCCKCCCVLHREREDERDLCIPDCEPEKCYGSQLEEEDVRFVLEQLKLSKDSLKRCMCDAVEQTPLLTDTKEKNIRENNKPAFGNTRSEMRQLNLDNDDYIPSHSDVSSSR